MTRRAALIIAALVLGSLVPADAASPKVDFKIQAGAVSPGATPEPFEYMRFYPEKLTVHRGQTIEFNTFGFHTTAFWPGGEAGRPEGLRRDESAGGWAVNEPVFKRATCGYEGLKPCTIKNLSTPMSSGAPIYGTTWRATIDLPPGTTIQYICLVRPGMNGTIKVAPKSVTLPSRASIDAEVTKQIAADTQEAIEYRRLRDSQLKKRFENGRAVWSLLAGDDTPSGHVSILSYMPSAVPDAAVGDIVEFIMPTRNEGHSVTFPTESVGQKPVGPDSRLASFAIHPACDLDDLTSGLPGIGGPYEPFAPLPCPGAFELVLAPWFGRPTRAPGDQVLTPATYHDSGLLTNLHAAFPTTFRAEFPVADEFFFACTLHGAEVMAGSVTVR